LRWLPDYVLIGIPPGPRHLFRNHASKSSISADTPNAPLRRWLQSRLFRAGTLGLFPRKQDANRIAVTGEAILEAFRILT
jgi:hypothetical protein